MSLSMLVHRKGKRLPLAVGLSALLLIAIVIAVLANRGGGNGDSAPASGPNAEQAEHGEEHSDIYAIDVGTRRLRSVTHHPPAQQPSWSHDDRIAFSFADCDECFSKLGYIDPSGRQQVAVRTRVTHLFQPTWSPDSRAIAVVALGRGIYSVALKDRTMRKLTSGQSDEAPSWSPRSDWIAFDKQVSGTNYDLYMVNAATRQVRRLTHDRRPQTNPSWSGDGSRIAFAEQQANGNWAIVTIKRDGSGRKRVTNPRTSAQEPSWSPDGRQIAFIQQGLDKASLAVVDANGSSKPEVLTGRSLFPARPTWSPNGESVAFAARAVPGPG
jgi:Tol biopolymer transport system component